MPDTALQRAAEFNLPDALLVESGRGDLPRITVNAETCAAEQYLHGATVTHWQPAGHEPVLFTSAHAQYRDGKAIRGGVPICFPWFGDHPADPDAPAHGLVRAKPWHLVQTALGPDGVDVDLVTHLDQLHADFRVTFSKRLTMRLIVTNTSDTDQTFEAALHTYFAVGDVKQVSIAGLEHAAYIDKVNGPANRNQGESPITFTSEVDRVYQNTEATCTLTDPVLRRRITVEKLGSKSTVVWNPWVEKAARLSDFGDDEWTQMCCIESANIADHAVVVAPGESHTLVVTVGVEAL